MSFGFGVGDFLAVSKLVKGVRERFVDAPGQYGAISNELRGLSIVLEDVNIILPRRDLTDKQRSNLEEIFLGCKAVLDTLEHKLKKYKELEPELQLSNSKSLVAKAHQIWQRLKWDPKDVADFRSRIVSNTNLLHAFSAQLERHSLERIEGSVERLQIHQNSIEDQQRRQTALDWLSSIDVSAQHNSFIRRRQPETGQWLLDSEEFCTWISTDDPQQILFCPGIPGAGKTIIASIVIDHLLKEYSKESTVGIAYIYCDFRRHEEQKPDDLFASLLRQLTQQQSTAQESIASLYECHKTKQTRPNCKELSEELEKAISNFSRVFIVLDALDECQDSLESRDLFLSQILDLQQTCGIYLFTTSRLIPEIMKDFEGELTREIRAIDEDLLRYVDARMPRLLRKRISRHPDLQILVRNEVLAAVDGMFLLAELHMNSLIGKPTVGDLKQALKNLPQGEKGLDTTYEQAMGRIECQEPDYRTLAIQVLSWITHAVRPLSGIELCHALGVRSEMTEFDSDFLPELEDLVSSCAGLVTFDKESDVFRLVHYTTQTFFERTWKTWFPDAHSDITSACITYISYKTFESGFCHSVEDFEARMQHEVLYRYAATYWGVHARQVSSDQIDQVILAFLGNDAKVASASQTLLSTKRYFIEGAVRWDYSRFNSILAPDRIGALHIAACFGLNSIIKLLLRGGSDANVRDGSHRTPLSYAAEMGHDDTVILFLARIDIEIDSMDDRGLTPLSYALTYQDEIMIKGILATGVVDINSTDNQGERPLTKAIRGGNQAIIRMILKIDGLDLSYKGGRGASSFIVDAIMQDDIETIKFLIATNMVDLNASAGFHGTPLMATVTKRRFDIAKMLLDTGQVDINATTRHGHTALAKASMDGLVAFVTLFLAKGADSTIRDFKEGTTCLIHAIRRPDLNIAEMLLATGKNNVNDQMIDGTTPLAEAARLGEIDAVNFLLKVEDVDINIQDTNGDTALSLAMNSDSSEEIVRLLLATGNVEINTQDKNGKTPLTCANEAKADAIIEFAEVETPNPEVTQKHKKLLKNYDNIIDLLEEHGAVAPSEREILLYRRAAALRRPPPQICLRRARKPAVDENQVYEHMAAFFDQGKEL